MGRQSTKKCLMIRCVDLHETMAVTRPTAVADAFYGMRGSQQIPCRREAMKLGRRDVIYFTPFWVRTDGRTCNS